jgi:glucokinase
LHPALMARMDERLIPPQRGQVQVLHSTLGDDAGLLGAAALALEP